MKKLRLINVSETFLYYFDYCDIRVLYTNPGFKNTGIDFKFYFNKESDGVLTPIPEEFLSLFKKDLVDYFINVPRRHNRKNKRWYKLYGYTGEDKNKYGTIETRHTTPLQRDLSKNLNILYQIIGE